MKIKNFNINKRVFIIAEIGNNHEGNFSNAKKLINLAAKAGADAVKFQTYKTENFVAQNDKKRFKQLKKFELTFNQFKALKALANKKKLKFISTPLDMVSSKFLIKIADVIKVASGDNNFFPLLKELLRSNKPLIISTGMTNSYEIKSLTNYIYKNLGKKKADKKVTLLHCVTSYPVEDQYANLNSIKYLIKKFNFTIGYSDHTIGNEACIAAVALGAKVIEKHFTINKSFSSFRDHALSADYNDLKGIVTGIRKLEKQLGSEEKKIQKPEKKLLRKVRRGAYAKKNIQIGELMSLENIKFLRPATSNNFLNLKKIIGKKSKKKFSQNQKIAFKN